jgi:hypothetical protein
MAEIEISKFFRMRFDLDFRVWASLRLFERSTKLPLSSHMLWHVGIGLDATELSYDHSCQS